MNTNLSSSHRRAGPRGRQTIATLALVAALGLAASAVFGATSTSGANADDCCPPTLASASAAPFGPVARVVRFFDNYGNYMPRIHCLRRADGTPDWPWIVTLLALNAGVMVGYAKIFRFWRRSYLAEAPRDRNAKLMDLAHIFLWCAVCGYGLSIVMFWWPAYRLNAIVLAVLNFFTWKFAGNLSGLRVSLSAFRLQRELEESFANRAAELERLVVERTAELEHARAAAIAADRAKSTFLANMSHEIRTPMTAILGFTQILAERDLEAGPRKRYTQIVRENSQHLLNVINDVLDMARIEAGQVTIARVPCDLPALLREVQSLYGAQAAERSLTLSLDVAPGVPTRVLTDPTRLRQVLFNLVGNALKFTERGGVTIAARLEPDGRAAIDVVDTGIGMTPEQSSRLFERFVQADPTTTRRFGGSGLGLVISRHLVTLLGGEIRVRSALGEGSRFTVAIPFERVADDAVAPPSSVALAKPAPSLRLADVEPRDQPLAGLNVLVADDAEDNRGLVRYLLEAAGARVELAHDGQEAIDAIVNAPGRFAAVLMDMHMPRLDGYGATQRLRSHGESLPIIAVTASSMAGDRERCLAAGCDAYATKPVDGDALIALIGRLTRATEPALAGIGAVESHDPAAEHDILP